MRLGASFQKQHEENRHNIIQFSTSTLFNNTEGLINTHLKLPPGGTRYPRRPRIVMQSSLPQVFAQGLCTKVVSFQMLQCPWRV